MQRTLEELINGPGGIIDTGGNAVHHGGSRLHSERNLEEAAIPQWAEEEYLSAFGPKDSDSGALSGVRSAPAPAPLSAPHIVAEDIRLIEPDDIALVTLQRSTYDDMISATDRLSIAYRELEAYVQGLEDEAIFLREEFNTQSRLLVQVIRQRDAAHYAWKAQRSMLGTGWKMLWWLVSGRLKRIERAYQPSPYDDTPRHTRYATMPVARSHGLHMARAAE